MPASLTSRVVEVEGARVVNNVSNPWKPSGVAIARGGGALIGYSIVPFKLAELPRVGVLEISLIVVGCVAGLYALLGWPPESKGTVFIAKSVPREEWAVRIVTMIGSLAYVEIAWVAGAFTGHLGMGTYFLLWAASGAAYTIWGWHPFREFTRRGKA